MKEYKVSPELFEQFVLAAQGDPRAEFGVGRTLSLAEIGSQRELHVHIALVARAPKDGGKTALGIVVLPFDARWNRLWHNAQQEVPMMRAWLWRQMSRARDEIDDEQFLAAQGD